MKTFKTNPIKYNSIRQATLIGIMIWSAHYHGGQGSQEYRMGCRARKLLERSNEIGPFLASRWFDKMEPYLTGAAEKPRIYNSDFSEKAREIYEKLAKITENSSLLYSPLG